MTYKDQFTPQTEDFLGPVFLSGICDNPQCREDVEAIEMTLWSYDIYFAKDGIICGDKAPKPSHDKFIGMIDNDELPSLSIDDIERYKSMSKRIKGNGPAPKGTFDGG